MIDVFRRLVASESARGIVLALAAVAALVLANSPWAPQYRAFLALPGEVRIGDAIVLAEPLLVWVNDLWMAVFFLQIGLEIKRELLAGELGSRRRAALPAAAALGGMIVPPLIYVAINRADAVALRGWAIPSATDIAFSLGILALLRSRVPPSLKVFLTAVAVIDDLGAILVIALFYTATVSLPMLLAAALAACGLVALNRAGVRRIAPYLLVGLVAWVCVLKSGVHPTVAGVVTGLAIPLRTAGPPGSSPLEIAERGLRPWVGFVILPVFAFVNAGLTLVGVPAAALLARVPLGIAVGLVVGKPLGVSAASWLLIRTTRVRLPAGATPWQFFGVAVLCGIGFTMSLFIGGLAFTGLDPRLAVEVKLGVLGGSLVAALLGALLLVRGPPGHRRKR